MKLTVIGLGKMGSTLVKGILATGVFPQENIIGCDLEVEIKDSNPDYGGIETLVDNKKGAVRGDIVILAVKPQVIDMVLEEIKPVVADKLIVSIAAGITSARIEQILPASCRIVRVMPNTPALVKAGISAISPGEKANKEDLEIVKEMLSGVGEVVEVKEELMDGVTGLSGSGPAYVYLMIEALADGGVLTGLAREDSQLLAAQTLLGAAKMVLETGKHPAELKDMVTSPAGTTIQGMEVLEKRGLRGILIDAVKAAAERSEELGAGYDG